MYLAFEAVPASRDGFYIDRFSGGIAERVAESLDGGIDPVALFNHRPVGPKPFADLLTEHNLSGMLKQHRQQSERLFLQPHLLAATAQFCRAEVEFELSKPYLARSPERASGCHDRLDEVPRRW